MPEDYQAILDDLGVDTSQQGAPAAGDSNQDQNQNQNQDNNADAGTPSDNNNSNPQAPADDNKGDDDGDNGNDNNGNQQQQIDADAQRRNEAFAAMRSENTKYKKFMQQIMKGAGFDGTEEAFMNQLTEASYKRQAQRQGNQVSPEILKRMDALENQNRTLIESQNRDKFITNLKNLQNTFKLKESEIKEFMDTAVREHIDLTVPGTNFITLYQGLFFDKLKDKMIEDARQQWIAQNNKGGNAANPDGKSGKKDPTPTNVNTMAEFNSLLQSIPNNK